MAATRSSSLESFYTAPSSLGELSSIVNLNGKSYHLTIYHKKPDSGWEEITESYLEQAKGVGLQKILQEHIKFPHKNIEITTSVDLKAGFVCRTKDTDGMMRKVAGFNLTESQKSKIFAVLKKIKTPKCIVTSSSLSEENIKTLSSSSIKMLLEVKAERVNNFLEQVAFNNKPVGFQNKSNNCGFNSCLQMIINEPALLHIYTTVAIYYAKSTEAKDRACGEQMLSILDSYDQAMEEQKSIPEEVSDSLRLAMHHLSPEEISPEHRIQEDANAILMILFSKYDYIVTGEEIIGCLQEYRNACKKQNFFLKVPPSLEPILSNKNVTEELLDRTIRDRRKVGEENLLNKSLMHCEIEHIVYHKIEKTIQNPSSTDYSTLNEDNTFVKKHIEHDLKIKFSTGLNNKSNLILTSLLQDHFHDKSVEDSEARKFMKGNDCVEASIVKEELKFSKLPKHLFINLERFVPNLEDPKKPNKLTNPVETPEKLDAKLLNVKDSPSGSYELSSFIVHLGSSLNDAHYMAYRKVQDQWMECNDGRVLPCSKEQALEAAKQSYICFYRLKDLPIPQLPT